MLTLALDTTTRSGSVALARAGELLDTFIGDSARSHGERLPGDVVRLLDRHRLTVRDVDLYAVASGPGSFTGLRVGIATVQALALATGRLVVPVPAIDALAHAGRDEAGIEQGHLIAAWMDAQRGDVFSALYGAADQIRIAGPLAASPEVTLDLWAAALAGRLVWFLGEGALRFREVVSARLGDRARILDRLPPLAPVIAVQATAEARAGRAVLPHAIVPLYVRRPDAELVRERRPGRPADCHVDN